MPSKLTLSLDAKVIDEAKKVSKRKGISLSKIVEDYLREFASPRIPKKSKSSIMKLVGILGQGPDDFDYRKELLKILEKKHLR